MTDLRNNMRRIQEQIAELEQDNHRTARQRERSPIRGRHRKDDDHAESNNIVPIQEEEARIEAEVQKRLQEKQNPIDGISQMGFKTGPPPFTRQIMEIPFPEAFKMPSMDKYDGLGDPTNHLLNFDAALLLHSVSDAIKCRAFPQTLKGPAQAWYRQLAPGSITSFDQLSELFVNQFIGGRTHAKTSTSLMSIVQGPNETLRNYINRFTNEALKVPSLEQAVAVVALTNGTRSQHLKLSLAKNPPKTMAELQKKVGKYISVEETLDPREESKPEEKKRKQGDGIVFTPEWKKKSKTEQSSIRE